MRRVRGTERGRSGVNDKLMIYRCVYIIEFITRDVFVRYQFQPSNHTITKLTIDDRSIVLKPDFALEKNESELSKVSTLC